MAKMRVQIPPGFRSRGVTVTARNVAEADKPERNIMSDDKIITMGGKPLPTPDVDEAKRVASEGEIEFKRKVMQRSAEIIIGSLERDVVNISKSALVQEHPLEKRLQMCDLARALLMTINWLKGPSELEGQDPLAETPQGINLPDKQDKPFFPPDQDGNVPNVKLPESPTIISP